MFLLLCGSLGGENHDGRTNKCSLNIGLHLCKSAFTVNFALFFVKCTNFVFKSDEQTGFKEARGDQSVKPFVDCELYGNFDVLMFF